MAGRHLEARAAPRRLEVHQQRDLVALQVLVKCGLGQVNWLASEQRLLALPAVGRAGKLVRTHAVGGLAKGGRRCAGTRSYRLAFGWCVGMQDSRDCRA